MLEARNGIGARLALSAERIAILATWGRLLLGLILVVAIQYSVPLSLIVFAAVVLADIFDGAIARHFEVDTVQRRLADAVVDRLILHLVAVSCVFAFPAALPFYLPLAIRDLLAIWACAGVYFDRQIVLKGGNFHKLASITSGLLFVAILTSTGPIVVATALLAWVVNAILLLDYVGAASLARATGPSQGLDAIRFDVQGLVGIRALLASSGLQHAYSSQGADVLSRSTTRSSADLPECGRLGQGPY